MDDVSSGGGLHGSAAFDMVASAAFENETSRDRKI
jgi:hypothetical protein